MSSYVLRFPAPGTPDGDLFMEEVAALAAALHPLPAITVVTDPEECDRLDSLVTEWREAHRG